MSKIFKNSEEKYMANYELFASSAKKYAFKDEAMTVKATRDEVVEMFKQGVIVNYGGKIYTPVECDASLATAFLAIVTVSGSTLTPVAIASATASDAEPK